MFCLASLSVVDLRMQALLVYRAQRKRLTFNLPTLLPTPSLPHSHIDASFPQDKKLHPASQSQNKPRHPIHTAATLLPANHCV